jgi:UDP-N-acetylglucosamine 4,6-dehydratase/5-epimerase
MNMQFFDNQVVLLTGGTGSFGNKFTQMILKESSVKQLIIFSRDEIKQWEMQEKYLDDKRIKFVIGDVRDLESLKAASRGVNHIVHAAATKIVPTAEYNPSECIKTNIFGAMNVIEASKLNNIKSVVALSTDKASGPINLYGATKLASDKLFIAANNSDLITKFACVRYGNVMGSRGSVIPFFLNQSHSGEITVTDKEMTRFMISLEDGVNLVVHAFHDMLGGELYIKKIPSMNIMDIASAVSADTKIKIIGIRPGEKLHEQMIGFEDSPFTFEYDDCYKILPSIYDLNKDLNRIKDGKKVEDGFTYTSNNNKEWMQIAELKSWIDFNLMQEKTG